MSVLTKAQTFGRKLLYGKNESNLDQSDTQRKLFSASDRKRLEKRGYDIQFIAAIQPEGGVTFYDKYASNSNGFFTFLTITSYRKDPDLLWLFRLFGNESTQVKMDVHTEDMENIQRQLNHSITEKQDQAKKGRFQTDMDSAAAEQMSLRKLALMFNSGMEIPKTIKIQIKIYADTLPQLEEKMSEISRSLRGDGYKGVLFQFTLPEQYRAWFQNYTRQKASLTASSGTTMGAATIGGGIPFYGQYLYDPHGTLYGHTMTNGIFMFDRYAKTPDRTSYNSLVLGQMGSGKSTFLKMMEKSDFDRNFFIRIVDKTGEYTRLVKSQGGVVIKFDGEDGMINPLQVFATATNSDEQGNVKSLNEATSFQQHVKKVLVLFSNVMNNSLDEAAKTELSALLPHFYVNYGLLPKDWQKHPEQIKITGLAPEKYPTLSEFREYVSKIATEDFFNSIHATAKRRETYESIKIALDNMIDNYGRIFDGISNLRDLENIQVVSFDTSSIANMDENIYHAQLFSILTLIQNQAIINGRKQVAKADIDRQYFSIYFDECHNIINANNMMAVNQIATMMREFRKYFAGINLATQDLGAMLPDNVSSVDLETLKSIAVFCQYKVAFRHEAGQITKLQKLLGGTLSMSDYERIPRQKQGEAIFIIGTTNRLSLRVEPSQAELSLFDGGR